MRISFDLVDDLVFLQQNMNHYILESNFGNAEVIF